MQTKKVSEPTFLHQIKRCFDILFGLSAQVNMAFIFEINTNLNENHKEMSYVRLIPDVQKYIGLQMFFLEMK
jgi:accessory colonization factor AcfC